MDLQEPHILIRVAFGGYIVDYEFPGDENDPGGCGASVFTDIPPVLKLVEKVIKCWEGPAMEIPDKIKWDEVKKKPLPVKK